MRVVIDTNVLIAGLFWKGPPHALWAQVRAGALRWVSSPLLLAELAEVLARPKFNAIFERTRTSPLQVLVEAQKLAECFEPPPLPHPVCRDPDDDHLLALARAAQVELIVSGDDDLLTLGHFQGIPILSPAQASALVQGRIRN